MDKIFQYLGETYYFNSENFTLTKSKNSVTSSKTKTIPKDNLQKVVINISNNCNLKCVYCYADGGSYGATSTLMTKETADDIICDLINKGIKQIHRLILFGGEPFLNAKLFDYIIETLSKNITIIKIETVTNGTILNSRVKNIIKKHNPFITISLDGTKEVHEKLRGIGTHNKTIKFIHYLKSINYDNFEIASTYTRLHQKSGITRDKLYKYFKEMDVRFNINDVFSKNKVLMVKEMELTLEQRKNFIDKSIEDIIENNIKSYISPILYDVLISMIYKSKNSTFCDDINPDDAITYDVDGSQKTCFRFWGSHNYQKVEFFNNKNNFPKCQDCWCKNMCMECVANMIDGYSSIIDEDGNFLECHKQELFEYCISKIIELSYSSDNLSKLVNNFGGFIRYA